MNDYNSILLKWLNKAYDLEMKSFRGYMYAVVTVTGPLHDVYEELYKKFAELEKEHLYEVGEKITALGGEISIACLPIDEIVAAVKMGYDEALSALQKVEDESLELYKKIHKLASAKNDTTLVLLVEHIMEEEQEHYDELARILMDTPGKNNVELHDELVVDAFSARKEKLAGLFVAANREIDMDAYIKRWVALNHKITEMLDEVGLEDDEQDLAFMPSKLKMLMFERDDIKQKLDDFDDNWMRNYFGRDEGGEEMDELEPVDTMRNYAYTERARKLAGLFVSANRSIPVWGNYVDGFGLSLLELVRLYDDAGIAEVEEFDKDENGEQFVIFISDPMKVLNTIRKYKPDFEQEFRMMLDLPNEAE